MRVTAKVNGKRCRTPECDGEQMEGRRFCPLCAARLDSIRLELEGGGNGARTDANATMDEATAKSFEEGLRRRAKLGQPLTIFERKVRAVRLRKYLGEDKLDRKVVSEMLAIPVTEMKIELAWYAAESEKSAKGTKFGGATRDHAVDDKLLNLLKKGPISNKDLSNKLGIPASSVPSRISRLRREGHQIPDRRGGPGKLKPIAA